MILTHFDNRPDQFWRGYQIRLLDAELDLATNDKERVSILEQKVKQLMQLEKVAQTRFQGATASQSDLLVAKVARLEAQVALERMRELDSRFRNTPKDVGFIHADFAKNAARSCICSKLRKMEYI